jgi:hypothetical protein
MNETPVFTFGAENKCRGRPARWFPSHTTHIQTLRLYLIQEQSSKGIVSDAPGYGNIFPEAAKGNRRIQGVTAGKDGDFITQYKFTRFWKPSHGTGEDVGYHVTNTENLFPIL